MRIRVGYEFIYSFPQPTPMILTVSIHYSRASDIIVPDHLTTDPLVPVSTYRDGFGNLCSRIVAPAGQIRIKSTGLVRDTGLLDVVVPYAQQHAVQDLPEETLVFLLGSRYCETDLLSPVAWQLFGQSQRGWPLVQTICDYVHNRITFDYQSARSTRTAWEAYNERSGVCRDFAHLAIAFCRCMNIPAVLHGLPGRHGNPAALRRPGSCRVDGSLSRWRMVHLRSSEQRAQDRASTDRARPRRG